MNNKNRIICVITVLIMSIMTYSHVLGRLYAVSCQEAIGTGNVTISSDCAFAGTVDGVDNGAAKNSASLTVNPGATLTIIPGQTIVAGSITIGGGKIIVFDGATIFPGGSLWMKDADSDGYPSGLDRVGIIEGQTAGVGYVRNSQIYQPTIADRDDTIPCPDAIFNPAFMVPLCQECYHGLNDPLPINSTDLRCGQGQVCNGTGSCYATSKRVFISSTAYNGSLGGLTGADLKCQTIATTAAIGGTWKAWLSNTTTNAADRLTHSDGPYYLVDNTTKIANNWAGVVSGSLLAGITLDEKLQIVGPGTRVWTNTTGNGTRFNSTSDETCGGWTSTSHRGRYGLNERFGGTGWTDTNYADCYRLYRLYCFEQ
jgi:hypothetical protein